MQNGTIGDIGPTFTDRVYLPDVHEIKAVEWKRIVEGECFIWMDYFSVSCACTSAQHSRIVIPTRPVCRKQVPQLSAVSKEGGEAELERTRSDMMKAIHSIPAYIERTSHFFAVCPAVPHGDREGGPRRRRRRVRRRCEGTGGRPKEGSCSRGACTFLSI